MNFNKCIGKSVALSYVLSALFTAICLIIILYINKIYPFGNDAYLWADSDQYISVQNYFSSLTGKNDVFYTWGNVLGGNALSQLAYYALSPFNLLLFIFHDNLMFAVHLITYSKYIASAIAFCFCLEQISSKDVIIKSLLSMSYAFMGYTVFFGWNSSWLDGVILLPLIYVGIKDLIQNRKGILYVICICLGLISNFYIGYMLCIASVLFYLLLVSLLTDKIIYGIAKTAPMYCACSLIGVGMSAVVLFPVCFALARARMQNPLKLLMDLHFNLGIQTLLTGFFTGQKNGLSDNAPLIFTGILPFVLLVLFFVNKKISKRKRIVYALALSFLIISFESSFINIIWHGTSNNVFFNYRYSFIFSFFVLIAAYESWKALPINRKECLLAVAVIVLIVVITLSALYEKLSSYTFLADIVVMVILLVFSARNDMRRLGCIAVVLAIVFCNIISNSNLYLSSYSKLSVEDYRNMKNAMDEIKKEINDDGFYRVAKDFFYSRCDALLFDYNGVTNYASTENYNNLEFVRKLGIEHDWVWGSYSENMPEGSEALLGLKYLITKSEIDKKYEKIASYGDINIYKNMNALPIVFAISERNENLFGTDNLFEMQNALWKSANNNSKDLFKKNEIRIDKTHSEKMEIDVETNGIAYLEIPEGKSISMTIECNDNRTEIENVDCAEIVKLGEFNTGDIINLTINSESVINPYKLFCYTEQRDAIIENCNYINAQNIKIEELSSSRLNISYNGSKKYMSSTIPFDEGWKVFDNGKEVEIEENWNNFLAFHLSESNEHNIIMIYQPLGFSEGAVISLISVMLFIMYVFRTKKSLT